MWDDASALGRLTRWLLLLMALMLIGTCIAWLYNSNHFPVKQVSIQGKLTYSDGKALQRAAQQHTRGNIFRADLDGIQAAFQKLPWVDSAMVRRRFPDTVEIHLTERVPVAHWRSGGLVDTKGNVFDAKLKAKLPVLKDSRVQARTWSNTTKNFPASSAGKIWRLKN